MNNTWLTLNVMKKSKQKFRFHCFIHFASLAAAAAAASVYSRTEFVVKCGDVSYNEEAASKVCGCVERLEPTWGLRERRQLPSGVWGKTASSF